MIKSITKCCRETKTRVKRNPLCSVLCRQIQVEGGTDRGTGWPQTDEWRCHSRMAWRSITKSPREKGWWLQGVWVKKGMFLIIRFLKHFFIPVDKSEEEELDKCSGEEQASWKKEVVETVR